MYVNEAASILEKCDKKSLKEGLDELTDILTYGLSQTGMPSEKIRQLLESSKNDGFNTMFNYLLENTCRSNNLREWSDNKSRLCEYVKDQNATVGEKTPINVSEGLTQLKNIVKESEEPWEAALYNDIINIEMGGSKEALFESYKTTCISKIDESIEASDVATKAKLNEMKDKLSIKAFNETTFYDDIIKMAELRSML